MENKNERRDFFKKITSVVGVGLFASAFGGALTSCEQDQILYTQPPPPETIDVDITKYPKLQQVGGFEKVFLTYSTGATVKVIIYRAADNEFKVFSVICTHMNWEIDEPTSAGGNFVCNLHGATFSSTDGKVIDKPFSNIDDLKNYPVYEFDAVNKILKIRA